MLTSSVSGRSAAEHGVGIDGASLVRRDERDVEPAPAQLLERLEHGVVLDRRRHDVPPVARGGRQAENRQVVAFRRAARENHIPAAAGDDRRDAVARLFDGGPGAAPELMGAAAGVAEVLVQVAQHLGADPRIQRRRRGTIEIDRHCRHHDARERRRETSLDPEEQLRREWALFQSVETGSPGHLCRCWQASQPVVVVGRSSAIAADVIQETCREDRVRVLRRFSGGGAVVLGPGCLNYAVVLSLVSWPELANVAASFQFILGRIVAALGIPGLSLAGGTDLVLDGRKVSGNAQRRGRRALIHHGTLLCGFDPRLAARYLKEPARQPAYRAARRHAEFMGNLPLSVETVRARLETAWDGGEFVGRPEACDVS